MLSDTLSDGLDAYRIGQKIRGLRQAKGLSLAQLGAHSGLSAGMLSKIENGQIVPTLPTLLRIAMVFGVGLDHFFASGEDRPVLEIVRREDRLRLPGLASGDPAFFFESLDFPVPDRPLESYLAEFPEGAPASDPHRHPGVELIYVTEGAIELFIHGGTRHLSRGDSIYFDSGFDHRYRGAGPGSSQIIVVIGHTDG
jgi:transcriptional regulator with XRE-family HTH domain